MIIDTQYGEFTLRYFSDAGIGEGIEAKAEDGLIVQLYGESIPDPDLTHDMNRLRQKIETEYEYLQTL